MIVTTMRTCAGGHHVADVNIIGMAKPTPDTVELYCKDHADLFDSRLVDIGALALQM